VLGRTEDGRLLLDLRAVDPDDDDRLGAAVLAAVRSVGGPTGGTAGGAAG
jgi:hypothetical protein